MDNLNIFSTHQQIDKSIAILSDFEKIRCKNAFSIPLSRTNNILKKISTDDIVDFIFLFVSLFVFLLSSSSKTEESENNSKSTLEQSYFNKLKDQLNLSNTKLRYIICFIALARVIYELFMVKFMNIKYSLKNRNSTMVVNLILVATLIAATARD
jgi:hypothetical protein